MLAAFEPPQEESQSLTEESSLLEAGLQRHANAAHVQNALSDDETKDEGGKDYGSPFLERTKSYGSFFKPQRPSAPLAKDDATLLTAAMRQSPLPVTVNQPSPASVTSAAAPSKPRPSISTV